MKKEKKQKLPIALKIIIIVLSVLIALMLILTVVFFSLRSSGKKSLYSKVEDAQPDFGSFGEIETEETTTESTVEEKETTKSAADNNDNKETGSNSENLTDEQTETSPASVESTTADNSGYVYQSGDVNFNGHVYRYNQDILTFLVLGIDRETEVPVVDANTNYLKGGQSDTILLMVMNPHDKNISVVAVNRNTMTDIDMYDSAGNYVRTAKAQICIQHGYGDGGKLSCERARKTVSELFYNLPIHGYISIGMGAVPSLNDAVGGVEITLPNDSWELGLSAGTTVRLNGEQAYNFVHNRNKEEFDSATARLNNQKVYLSAFMNQVFEATKNDITFPVSLYQKLSSYIVTDIGIDEMSYLASELVGYSVGSAKIYTVPGQTVMGNKFEEFYVDENALKQQMLEIFYEVVK